jgi:hypothetical protein
VVQDRRREHAFSLQLESRKVFVTTDAITLARIVDLANIIVHEPDGAILHWSSGCERLYG